MAITPKSVDNMQVFRGSKPAQDVFAQNSGTGCCDTGAASNYDKLAPVVHFDNALAHLNPAGANDKFRLNRMIPGVVEHIAAIGVGAQISVLTIPTGAVIRAIAVRTDAEEAGLTFNLVTRNGLALPATLLGVTVTPGASACDPVTRVTGAGDFDGVGVLAGSASQVDNIGLYAGDDITAYSLEADELILEVATVPAIVNGTFDLTVAVVYDIVLRA